MTPRTALPVVFFDVGDTLVFDDPPLAERLRRALTQTGMANPAPEVLKAAVRVGERVALSHYLDGIDWAEEQSLRPAAQAIVQNFGVPALSDADWQTLRAAFLSVPFVRHAHPQAAELLTALRERGHTLGVISDWDATLDTVLTGCGLRSFFHTVTASHAVGHTKPHLSMFHDALSEMNAAPADCLHVGDWYALDVCGARAAHMNALLFDHAGRSPDADCPRVLTFGELCAYLLSTP